jgi:holo-[acyl-carrier protein] synthase
MRLLGSQQIGIDIVKIERFREKKIFENQSFYEKIFTKSEISYCKRFIDPYPHFAGKFALKEAIQKSINENLIFNKIETFHSNSRPKIKLEGSKEKYKFVISISHENEYAIAIALSKKEN